MKFFVKEILPYVAIVAAVLLLNKFVLINAKIPSQSMETTLMTHDRLFGNRLAYMNEDPQRHDIVIFRYPDDETQLFVKRLIGLPGDTIELRDGVVYINGEKDEDQEEFTSTNRHDNYGPVTVPEGCYFMLGDNRAHSNDSRFWNNTFVKREQIVARAGFRYWPLNQIGFVNKHAKN
ncbi:MAG: signal peptidase I [Lachnospiraceae bacterium]|nr:signal peptidase I [Lachnospiraceae bacterium]